MSRIRVTIGRVVLNGFEQLDAKALMQAMESQLSQVLAGDGVRNALTYPYRRPVLKLGRMTLDAGTTGARKFGRRLGKAVGRGLTR